MSLQLAQAAVAQGLELPADFVADVPGQMSRQGQSEISPNAAIEHQRCKNKPAQGNALGTGFHNGQALNGRDNIERRNCAAPTGLAVISLFPKALPGLVCCRAFGPQSRRSGLTRQQICAAPCVCFIPGHGI
jgi:hypothetical protein